MSLQTDPDVKSSLYKELTYACLYLPPPEGFTQDIQFAEEFLNDPANLKGGLVVAKIYTNLAAAYGQKYHWYKLHPDSTVDLKALRAKALNAVKQALDIDPSVREQLQMLMDPAYPDKSPEENDLEDFVDDPEFREALGMPKVSDQVF
jgi:hypothetical protein